MSNAFSQFVENQSMVKNGLPAFAYTSEAFEQLEKDTLFANHWVFVGFTHQLQKVGDVQPIMVAGKPVLLVRSAGDTVKAFHNVCRHRCLKLVDKPGNVGGLIRCPYHSWSYNLQGDLKVAPYFGGRTQTLPPGFSLADNGLKPVRCERWHDWLFVNLSGDAQDFTRFIAPIEAQIGELQLNQIKPVACLDLGVVKTNWKLLMENFIEPYHVQFVHKTTTQQPLTDHYTIIDQHCLGSACDIEEDENTDTSTTLAVTSHYLTLFPNFVMGIYAPDQVGVHLNIPLSVNETRQYRVIYIHQDNTMPDSEIEKLKTLWYDVHKEDHAICERLQLGRHSKVADGGGFLSPHWENSVHRFQQLVVESTASNDVAIGSHGANSTDQLI